MLRIMYQASGYVWPWLANHDNDTSTFNQLDSVTTQICIYGARDVLIES